MMSNSTEKLTFNSQLIQRTEDIDSGKATLVSGDALDKQAHDFFESQATVKNNPTEQLSEPFSSMRGLFKGQSSVVPRENDRI